MEIHQVNPLIFKTYLRFIRKCIGVESFQTLYAIKDGEEEDILNGGELSCAFFTSVILSAFGFIQSPHATVEGTLRDLKRSGWKEIVKPVEGCILIWDYKDGHTHIGFYIGGDRAISNDSNKKTPSEHHITFGEENGEPKRKVISMWWREGIENS